MVSCEKIQISVERLCRMGYTIKTVDHRGEGMSENTRSCRLCKQSMKISPFTMCSECLVHQDKVQQYIQKNPHVSMHEISQATKVPFEFLQRMVELGLDPKEQQYI